MNAVRIGRDHEFQWIQACLDARKNVLLEGPVGVGKTTLALSVAQSRGVPVFRIDGDSRYSEQKLTGWFDPPIVLQKGYNQQSFVPGPLSLAMQKGGVLFINELNRFPEGVQNVLLPAIDEGLIQIPRLGELKAGPAFRVIATQNPKEFVATNHLSEAILDRFELILLEYQSAEEEVRIVEQSLGASDVSELAKLAVALIRRTRDHEKIHRGASIRAALSVSGIAQQLRFQGSTLAEAFVHASVFAIPTRIELNRELARSRDSEQEVVSLVRELAEEVLAAGGDLKKKPKSVLKT